MNTRNITLNNNQDLPPQQTLDSGGTSQDSLMSTASWGAGAKNMARSLGFALMACVVVALAGRYFQPTPPAAVTPDSGSLSLVSHDQSPGTAKFKAIQDIRLGDRVHTGISDSQYGVAVGDPALLPWWDQIDTQIVPADWRQVSLQVENRDGNQVEVHLLRPLEWLDQHQAVIGSVLLIELAELGVEGPGAVQAIESCPEIESGEGRVVIGRFIHRRDGVLQMRVAGLEEPLGVTDTHHIYSVDRDEFIPAGELEVGDTLELVSGPTKILAIEHQTEAEEVYNLEVHGQHVFRVSTSGLLVHNTNGKCKAQRTGGNQVFRGDSAFSATVNAKGIPKSFIDDAGNLVPASTTGIYKGRQVTVGEHVLGGYRRGAKGNSPFTSLTPNASTAADYGSEVAGVNISALRQAIRSGEVTGVAVLNQRQIQRLIRNNSNLSDYWKNLASKWAARDGEFLIRGTVPERFIIRGGQ